MIPRLSRDVLDGRARAQGSHPCVRFSQGFPQHRVGAGGGIADHKLCLDAASAQPLRCGEVGQARRQVIGGDTERSGKRVSIQVQRDPVGGQGAGGEQRSKTVRVPALFGPKSSVIGFRSISWREPMPLKFSISIRVARKTRADIVDQFGVSVPQAEPIAVPSPAGDFAFSAPIDPRPFMALENLTKLTQNGCRHLTEGEHSLGSITTPKSNSSDVENSLFTDTEPCPTDRPIDLRHFAPQTLRVYRCVTRLTFGQCLEQ